MNTDKHGWTMRSDAIMSQDWLTTGVARLAGIARWALVIGVALIVNLGTLSLLFIGSLGDCWYDLTVTVNSVSATPIKEVRGMTFFDAVKANEVVNNPRATFEAACEEQRAFNGKSLVIDVGYDSWTYCFGLWHSDNPPRFLVLIVDYHDGKRTRQLVGIPHHSVARAIAVEVP
jgi:hypothetical protein